tara:strand:- start:126 stop:1289 length:1164 start_codon:yes stop_codon:yes gene_type:complete
MSEIKVNSIKGVGASAAAITVNNSDGTCTANLTNRTNKNLVVNGACLIAQRGTSSTSGGYQTVDRFKAFWSGTDEALTQAQVDVASGTTPYTSGFRKALKVTNGNQTSGAGAADYVIIRTILEAQDIANSGWNYVSSSSNITLSFWVKSSVAQNFYGTVHTKDSTEFVYRFETGSLSADTWTKITKTIPGNNNLTFNNDNGEGLRINIFPFFGTDYTASVSLNAWFAYSLSTQTPDSTSTWYTTNDSTLEITGVQLEVGSVATDFEHRSFAQEFDLCRRYYERWDGAQFNPFITGMAYQSTIGIADFHWYPKRDVPSLEYSNLSHFDRLKSASSSVSSAITNLTLTNTGPKFNYGNLYWNHDSMTGGQAIMFRTNSNSAYLAISSEL